MTHTPGPWRVSTSKIRRVITGHGIVICNAVMRHAATEKTKDAIEAEAISNARVIAAAPELLEALDNLVIGIGMGWDLEGMIDVARAAIAKARGQ